MKVLVTGATGFLGSHTAEQLVGAGHEVKALVRKTSNTSLLEQLGVETRLASLEAGEGLEEAIADVDAIVHAAAMVKARGLEEFRRVNAGGTKNLLDAVLRKRPDIKRFVYVSSLGAPGFRDGRPCEEHEDPQPVTHYSQSKLEGERAVLEASEQIPVTVLRPPAIYGPRDGEMFNFFQMVSRGMSLFIHDSHLRASLVYGPDCARAIRDMLHKEHPSGRIYYVEDGRVYTHREIAQILEQVLGKRTIGLEVPLPVARVAALGSELYGAVARKPVMLTRNKLNELSQPSTVCSSTRIREELGWEPEVQFEEGARRTAEWYQAQGWL